MVDEETKALHEKAQGFINDPLGPPFKKEGITPEQFAKDKKLVLDKCRKEITKKRKSKQFFTATGEMRREYEQVIGVRGWKAPERKQLTGTLTLEQAVKELEKEDG